MFVYSKAIIRFSQEVKQIAIRILSKEVGLRCTPSRFFDRKGSTSYPLQIVIYNNRPMLGYFDAAFYELGFHERLMHCNKETLFNIVRHELAHYMTFINHGSGLPPHSAEFKQFCKRMGWGEEVSAASIALETEESDEDSAVLRKVKKLMALGQSSHPHEAELAVLKSQQLLLKHHLDESRLESDEKVFMQRVLKQKRESAKLRAIGSILRTFFVDIVYHRGSDGYVHLEVFGEMVNLKIASYVAFVLENELERLWLFAQKTSKLKGKTAKNSFFLGVTKGYCQKVNAFQKEHTSSHTQALLVIEKKLVIAKELIYPRLFSKKVSGNYCPHSSLLGEKAGKNLQISTAIEQSAKRLGNLLT